MKLSYEERNEIVKKNIPLVTSRVKKLNNGVYNQDLFQEGCLALVIYSDRYDSQKGVAFSTYITKCIDGRILTYKNRDTTVRPLRRGSRLLWADVCSLNKHITADNDVTLEDILPNGMDVIQNLINDIYIDTFLKSLNERDRVILNMYIGGFTQQKISNNVGLTISGVRGVLKKIRKKYREYTMACK